MIAPAGVEAYTVVESDSEISRTEEVGARSHHESRLTGGAVVVKVLFHHGYIYE
jgi:hypothetical protein